MTVLCTPAGIVTTIQEDLRDQKMEIPDIKQDVWKRFLGLEAQPGGEEMYISLLMQICNNKLSMQEAGEQATDFKLQATCQRDICKKLGIDTWAEAEILYHKHCTRDAIQPLLLHYTKRTAKTSKELPAAVDRHCNAALAWKDGNDRVEDPETKVYTGTNAGHYDYKIEGITPSEDQKKRSYYKVIHADMTKLASSGLVPKLKFRFVLLDVWYEFHDSTQLDNPEAMDSKTFGNVLDQVLALSTSPLVTIIVFMSHLQKCGFETEMRRACNAGVELAYWSKVQSNNLPGNRLTNIVEEMLIGYHNNSPSAPSTYRVPEFFRFVKGEARTNIFECHKVTKYFKKTAGHSKALNVDQKPMALYEKLFYTLNDQLGDTVLDLGCGTAAASAAAINRGMNVIAVDNDKHQVRGAYERLANKNDLPDADEERNVIRGRFVPGGTYKGKKKNADNDEDEQDEDELMEAEVAEEEERRTQRPLLGITLGRTAAAAAQVHGAPPAAGGADDGTEGGGAGSPNSSPTRIGSTQLIADTLAIKDRSTPAPVPPAPLPVLPVPPVPGVAEEGEVTPRPTTEEAAVEEAAPVASQAESEQGAAEQSEAVAKEPPGASAAGAASPVRAPPKSPVRAPPESPARANKRARGNDVVGGSPAATPEKSKRPRAIGGGRGGRTTGGGASTRTGGRP